MVELERQPESDCEIRLQRALIALAIIALPIAAGLYLMLPPSMDQWQLDYTGWLIVRGEVPYLDIRDGNWPGSHWLHAISIALSGPAFGGWRRFDLLLLVPAVIAGGMLCGRIWGRSSAYWFGLLYPCLYISSGYWFAGQRDIVASHFGLIAITAYWETIYRRGRDRSVLSGVSLTVAALIKPTFAIFAPLIALHAVVLVLTRRMGTEVATRAVVRIAGWSIAALLLAILFLAIQGTTAASFWEHAVWAILNRLPNNSLPAPASLSRALDCVFTAWHWIFGGAVVATVAAIRSGGAQERSGVLLCWLVVLCGFASHVVQGHALDYYLAPVFLGLVLLCSGALGLATRSLSAGGLRRAFAMLAILVALAGTGKKMAREYADLTPVVFGDQTLHDWENRFEAGDGLSARDARTLATELRNLLPDDATLFVWGRANVLNLLVERPQPTGFYHRPHFVQNYLLDEGISDRWMAELLGDLRLSPPAVIFTRAIPSDGGARIQVSLREFLASRYRAVRLVGSSTLYVLDGPDVLEKDAHFGESLQVSEKEGTQATP